MSLRDAINNNSAMVTVLAVLLLVAALGTIVWQMGGGGPPRPGDRYYYDLDTGQIFAAERQAPPVASPGGAEGRGIAANIHACGECPNVDFTGMTFEEVEQAGAFVHSVETYTDEAVEAMRRARESDDPQMQEEMYFLMEEGQIIARADDMENWYSHHSEAGYRISGPELMERCPGDERPQRCNP